MLHANVILQVRLRTIDNYQGEEAKVRRQVMYIDCQAQDSAVGTMDHPGLQIVLLSLVRNSGGSEDDAIYGHAAAARANIGFLRVRLLTSVL